MRDSARGNTLMKSTTGNPSAQRKREIVADKDVRIEVVCEGAGPLVVILPSRGGDSEDYDEFAAGIATAGYRVLRPQPRGTGASTGPMNGLTLHDFARDVAAVIEHAGGGPAVVVGHAFGNWIARMTAPDHPRLVRRVAIPAAAAKTDPKALAEAVTRSADVTLPDAERLKYLRSTFFAPGHDAKNVERSEEHTSELQSPDHLVCRLLLEKKKHPVELHT